MKLGLWYDVGRQTTDSFVPTKLKRHKDSCAFWEVLRGTAVSTIFMREINNISLKNTLSPEILCLQRQMPCLWHRYSWNINKPLESPHREELLSPHSAPSTASDLFVTKATKCRFSWTSVGRSQQSSVKQWGYSFKCFSRLQLLHGRNGVCGCISKNG